MDLNDAHVLVTGASRGVGAVLAERFTDAGARTTLVARSEEDLRGLSGRLAGSAWLSADLAEREGRDGLIACAEEKQGPLDVLVNNAGIDLAGAFAEIGADNLEKIIALNALAPMELCRQAIPGMRERGAGHIVNVSSLAGTAVLPGMAAYSSTKAALTHFSSGLRADLRGLSIGITVVEIGLIPETGIGRNVISYEPTADSLRRFYRLGLLSDVGLEQVCTAIVGAVRRNRRSVRYPRRSSGAAMLTETPRRMTEAILSGVTPR